MWRVLLTCCSPACAWQTYSLNSEHWMGYRHGEGWRSLLTVSCPAEWHKGQSTADTSSSVGPTSFSLKPSRGLGPSCSSQHSGAKGTSPLATPPNMSRPASTATMTGPARVPGSFPLLFCTSAQILLQVDVCCGYSAHQPRPRFKSTCVVMVDQHCCHSV